MSSYSPSIESPKGYSLPLLLPCPYPCRCRCPFGCHPRSGSASAVVVAFAVAVALTTHHPPQPRHPERSAAQPKDLPNRQHHPNRSDRSTTAPAFASPHQQPLSSTAAHTTQPLSSRPERVARSGEIAALAVALASETTQRYRTAIHGATLRLSP